MMNEWKKCTGAVLYARFSPRPNADSSPSNIKQIDLLTDWCQQRDIKIIGRYKDGDLSGDDIDREGIWDAMDALRSGNILLAVDRSRLFRSVYVAEIVKRKVRKRRARIVVITGNIEDETPEGQLLTQIIDAFYEYQRKIINKRSSIAVKRKLYQGIATPGIMSIRPPYGYRIAAKKDEEGRTRLEPNVYEIAVIKRIFELYEDGYRLQGICDRLTKEGYETRKKTKWQTRQIKRLIERISGSKYAQPGESRSL